MNPEELEAGIKYVADRPTTQNIVSALTDNENDAGRTSRRSRNLENRRISMTARRSMTETHKLQRSIAETVSSQALHIFLYNTVIQSPENPVSKGHFTNLVVLVQSSSKSGALPHALEAVALASLAHRFSYPEAKLQAMSHYHVSVRLLRDAELHSISDALSVVACILLLGIYEIINADLLSNLNWMQHLDGMIAVMKDFVGSNQLTASGIPTLVIGSRIPNVGFSQFVNDQPSSTGPQPAMAGFDDLCSILCRVQRLFGRANTVLEPQSVRYESILRRYREEATALKSELLAWEVAQSANSTQHKPTLHFTQPYTMRFPGVEDLACPTTRAVAYNDYSTACTWISYYQCQLHLTDLLTRISHTLSTNPEVYAQGREYAKWCNEVRTFVDDICASIPFMLVGEIHNGTKPRGSIWLQARPPMLLGGLNLQWVLFTVSILDIVPISIRQNANTLLLWIGKNLGIGQATVLAYMDKNPPGGVTAKGDALTWAGFLI